MSQAIATDRAPSGAHPDSTEVPTSRVAMWWFLASEVAIFGGLITVYVMSRLVHPEWGLEAKHTVTAAGALNTMVLLTSSLSAVLAHDKAHRGDGPGAARNLYFTLLGGLVFLCVKAFEYTHEISEGFTPIKSTFWSFYFFMTGLHGLHVVAGMTALFFIAQSAKAGKKLHRVEYGGMYWHLVDIVWIFLFPLLYLAS
jgi:heme/copper-type cytochrome/quinol oxidase subunit 3